jgi:hypothetical protein
VRYDKLKGKKKTKAFTTGILYPFLKSGDVFVCQGIPKTGRPPVPQGGKEYADRVFGYDKGHGFQPGWSYVNNAMPEGCQLGGRWDWSINPDMVKPSPANVFLFMDQVWNNYVAFDNTVVFFSKMFNKKDTEIYKITTCFLNSAAAVGIFHVLMGNRRNETDRLYQ